MGKNNSSGSLGWPAVWALAAGGMVGGGIYTALGVVVAVSGQWAWLSFVISGIIAASSAYSYVVLANHYKESGGAFTFLREINKEGIAGSLSWLLLMGYVLTMAVYAFAFGHYLSFSFNGSPMISRLCAVGIMAALISLNLAGVTKTKKVEIAIVSLNLIALIGLAVIGFLHWDTVKLVSGIEPRAWWSAPIGAASIFMAYEGFQLLTYEYDEIKNPKKILKPTIMLAVFFVILIYAAVAIGAVMLAGALAIISQKQVSLSVAAQSVLGTPGLVIMTLAAVFATAAAINSTLFSSSNLSKRVADDNELPPFFKKTHNNVPYRAIILLGIMSTVLAVIGKLSSLVEAASMIFLITFGIVNIIALRYIKKGWKWIAWLGISIGAVVLIVLLLRLMTVAPIQLGILLFLAFLIILGRPALMKRFSSKKSKNDN
ncbi:amino acid permease [Christiangramia fulva]|uniref:Amino acid permease n=1 Tax=Christiangramia fulva TaxID=2126553 RepID=A0A2R3Z7P3_9FLAO|nr:APC family permease [Christiangramia fulva]AVR46313.1 amino acid permease [Christiangramia fulva]